MKKSLRFYFLTAMVLVVLVFSAVDPLIVRADDSTPVAPTSPPAADTSAPATPAPAADTSVAPVDTSVPVTAVATTAASTDTTVAPADTSAPATTVASTDTTVAQTDTSAPATTVASTDTSVAPTDTTAAATTAAPSATDMATVLSQVPTGTPVVVVDATGTAVPLATQAAADIIQTGDPMWCPGSTLPGGAGCTTGYANVAALITGLGSVTPAAGIVYFESTYNTNDATFDGGGSLSAWKTYALTLQGGWDGSTGVSGVSTFSVPLTVTGWAADVTINDITINGTNSTGLTVTTSGNIKLHNVSSNGNRRDGADLNAGSGTISVDNSAFNDNEGHGSSKGYGLEALSNGAVTLTDVTANDNHEDGVYVDPVSGPGDITLTNVTANDNHKDGVYLDNSSGTGDITLTDVTADDNHKDGAYVTSGNDIIVNSDSEFYDNGFDGLYASAENNITISNTTADDNGWVCQYYCFDDNGYNGFTLYANGTVSMTNVIADDNYGNGAQIGGSCYDACDGFPVGDVTVTGGDFSDNAGIDSQVICFIVPCGGGLLISSAGAVNLTDVTANDNAQEVEDEFGVGAAIFNLYGDAPVTINGNNAFNENGVVGLFVLSSSDVNASGVTADNNGEIGAYLANEFADPPNINISDSQFDNNSTGLVLEAAGNATVTCSTANNNETGVGGEVGGTFTMNGFNLDDNLFPSDVSGTTITNPTNCNPGHGNSGGGLPLNIIPNSGAFDCSNFSGNELVLPNQDHAILPCPNGQGGTITGKTSNELPSALDSKFTYVSAFDVEVNPSLIGTMTVSFKIPAGKEGSNFTILHWDGSKWVSLGGSINPPGFFSVDTNLTGFFALAIQ